MKCEECGSEDIEFHETYDTLGVAVSTRIIIIIAFLIGLIITLILKEYFFALILFITALIFGAIIKLMDKIAKSKSHTKAICKNCGHIEYLD